MSVVQKQATDPTPQKMTHLGLVFLLPMIRPILAARLTRSQLWLFGWRGLSHTLAVILWFYAMTQIPIAEVTSMGYLTPIFVTIGAALFLSDNQVRRIHGKFMPLKTASRN